MPTENNVEDVLNGATLAVFASSMFQGPGNPPQIILETIQDVQFTYSPAPEPSSFAVLGVLSLAGAGWYRRRERKKSAEA